MKSQKGIIHLGLIIVLLVFGIGALVFVMYKTNSLPVVTTSSPTPSYTSDDAGEWLSYVNEKLGFAFRYPKYWPGVQYPGETEVKESENRVSINFLESGMSFSVVTNKTAKQWFSEKISGSNSYNRYDPLEETNLNGYSAFKTTFYGDRFDEFYYLIQRDKNLVVISTNLAQDTQDKILSTFEFMDTSTPVTQETGANLSGIKYTLPGTWKAELNGDTLLLTANGGGYLSVKVYDYPGTGRREYFCQVTVDICTSDSYFTAMQIGNISGYRADALDNSGGGSVYFGAKGDKFYIIGSYSPPAPNEFQNTYQQVLSSLVF